MVDVVVMSVEFAAGLVVTALGIYAESEGLAYSGVVLLVALTVFAKRLRGI